MAERSGSDALTVDELVQASGLGITLVGGAQGAAQQIEAVYIGDLEDPTPWMVPGSLLLTTGPTFEAHPEDAVCLVKLLKKNRMVGVGVAITPHVETIPTGMIAAADSAGLPVLRVPPETPFRTITSYVFNALASWDMHRLRRSLALQNTLLQVLLEEDGVEGLVRRLAEFLDGETFLFEAHGRVLAASSSRPQPVEGLAARVWEEYHRVSLAAQRRSVLEVGEYRVRFREARVDGVVERVLATASQLAALVSEFEEATLTFAQRLIEVELNTTRNASGVRRRTRSALLEMLVHGRGSATELGERLLYHGILPSQAWRMLLIDASPVPHAIGALGLQERLDSVDAWFEERGLPFLSMPLDDEVVVLSSLERDGHVAEHREILAEASRLLGARVGDGCVRIGASEPLLGAESAPLGLAHARQALDQTLHGGHRSAELVLYEDLGLRAVALDVLPPSLLTAFSEKVVGRLEAADGADGTDLAFTLKRYLAHDCSVAKTAEELYLHRNTLRKRLARIERIVGLDLACVDDVVEAYLSIHAAETARTRET